MKRFVFLHYGFEKPTPEIMSAWGKWFEAMKDNIIDMGGHFSVGREISKAGTKDLPLGRESITGLRSYAPTALMLQKRWRKAIRSYRASESMK